MGNSPSDRIECKSIVVVVQYEYIFPFRFSSCLLPQIHYDAGLSGKWEKVGLWDINVRIYMY